MAAAFRTIACGAISGWHSLVSSSGTARSWNRKPTPCMWAAEPCFWKCSWRPSPCCAPWWGGLRKIRGLGGKGANAGVFANGWHFLSKIGIPVSFGLPYGSVFLTLMALTSCTWCSVYARGQRGVPWRRRTGHSQHGCGDHRGVGLSAVMIWTGFWSYVWILFAAQPADGLHSLAYHFSVAQVQGEKLPVGVCAFIFMFITSIAALLNTAWESSPPT